MDYNYLAELLFPNVKETVEDLENRFPQRDLPEGAFVTRIAPSPTGFMHLGNLFGALIDERLAHQSGGVFYLRIEDTDQERKVEGAVELILSSLEKYGLKFDEGYDTNGGKGNYGPYIQSSRAAIYHVVAKYLVQKGLAYPCFCSKEELDAVREKQSAENANPGYYGKWASCRNLSIEEIEEKIKAGQPYVLRLRSMGDPEKQIKAVDLVKGELSIPESNLDIVLLKSDGIPTYHFAHVCDDHFMRTTHVVRGEEWLSTFPWHLQLFEYIGWEPPKFIHTAHMMKLDGDTKRKLSKRKDPEFGMQYYFEAGYPKEAVIEYLLTVLNSNFEEWRIANPDAHYDEFKFTVEKMSASGALFDMDKLIDITKNIVAKMSAEEVYNYVTAWASEYDKEFYNLLVADGDYAKRILSIGRNCPKPRKDITLWSGVKSYMDFFYDELFVPAEFWPDNISEADCAEILAKYPEIYDENDDQETWFAKMKTLAGELGFAPEMKLFKKNPTDYKGHVGDIAMVVRLAVTGKKMSPDTYECMKILGKDRVLARINDSYKRLIGEK